MLTSSGPPTGLIALEHYTTKPYTVDINHSHQYFEGVASRKNTPVLVLPINPPEQSSSWVRHNYSPAPRLVLPPFHGHFARASK